MGMNWRMEGVCADMDPDVFFPDRDDAQGVKLAKEACEVCPARALCLEAGLNEEHGIWGGLDELERWRLAHAGKAKRKYRPKTQAEKDAEAARKRRAYATMTPEQREAKRARDRKSSAAKRAA